ncbi:HepT-like ribonuclease domain-containing protein [Sulfurovum sp. NBC37-1]|uniref:HepT-like ribonuclease domain-containing protein n=1 Tax=Sulfurovum sp. (strain NBC37-1) TaxID=387093 RepID=UPI00015878E4|nr:DUF86 domain-containing protein [Sulfurovum sp. NBC37-1]BAF71109.1 conserved hypothetical protein [Sulfurovum sp. NBC37-1]
MPSTPLVKEIILQVENAITTIKYRFEPVNSVDDFLDTPQGQEKLDSLCMLFIAIGESLKNIDKLTDKQLLQRYDHIDWKAIKGMRDILSHHYFDMNAEAVFNVCNEELDSLHQTIQSMIEEL